MATNPVDIMTRIVYEISGFSPEKVIGTGTALDTARLRYLLGEKFMIDPRNMHAYVMGEHGDKMCIRDSICSLWKDYITKVIKK